MRKRMLCVGMSIVMAALLSACGGGQTASEQTSKETDYRNETEKETEAVREEGKKTVVEFWTTNSSEFKEEIENFEKENPDIDVVTAYQGKYDEMFQKLQSAAVSKKLPQVAQMGERFGVATLDEAGLLVSLDDLLSKETIDDVLPAFWGHYTYKGNIIAAPFQCSTPIMYYNKTLFEEKNIPVPKTTEEVVEAAKMATSDENGDGVNEVWGFTMDDAISTYFKSMVLDKGGQFYDENGRAHVNTKEAEETLQWMKDLVFKYNVMAPNQYLTAYEDFSSGKVAILFASGASLGNIKGQVGEKFVVGTALLPTTNGNSNVMVGGNCLGIFHSTPEQEAASAKLVEYLMSTKVTANFSMQTGYIPVRQSALELDEYKKFLEENPDFKVSIDQMKYIFGLPVNPVDTTFWEGIVDCVEAVSDNEKTEAAATLNSLQANLDEFASEQENGN